MGTEISWSDIQCATGLRYLKAFLSLAVKWNIMWRKKVKHQNVNSNQWPSGALLLVEVNWQWLCSPVFVLGCVSEVIFQSTAHLKVQDYKIWCCVIWQVPMFQRILETSLPVTESHPWRLYLQHHSMNLRPCTVHFFSRDLIWPMFVYSNTFFLIFVVPCIMLYSGEISPTRCNNCVFYSQWLYSTCFGWQSHPSSGVQCCIWPQVSWLT